MSQQNTKYLVLIAAGSPSKFGPKVGWDELWDTRAAAEDCAQRARSQDGWAAKVVTVDAEVV